MHVFSFRGLVYFSIAAFFICSCSDDPTAFRTDETGIEKSDQERNSSDKKKNLPRIEWPEKDMANDGDDNAVEKIDLGDKTIVGNEKWENLFWLNFAGGEVTAEESFIIANLGQTSLQIEPFSASDINSTEDIAVLQQTILTELQKLFDGIYLKFTFQKPTNTPHYSTVHIGGSNFTDKPGLLGRAPMDYDNFNSNDVLFVFSKELKNYIDGEALTLLVHTIAHEMAHALGLRHIENTAAIMNPAILLTTNDFNEEGSYIELEGTENSFDVLLKNVGASAVPNLEETLPRIEFLATKSQGNIGQFSVFELRNIIGNPNHRLGDFNYEWTFKKFEPVNGPSIRIAFSDTKNHTITLRVSLGEYSEAYRFQVRHPNASE